jgi:hypothetical protein
MGFKDDTYILYLPETLSDVSYDFVVVRATATTYLKLTGYRPDI